MINHSGFFEKYHEEEAIGKGSFGEVFRAVNKHTGEQVAVKKIPIPSDARSLKRLLREILLLKYLKYEHLVKMIDAYFIFTKDSNRFIYFVFELMHTNMNTLMTTSTGNLTPDHIKFFLYQIFLGLAYLHLNNIVHRDIKPDNILLNRDNVVKIADFGWARQIAGHGDLTKVISNIHYRAPEISFRNQAHDHKVDIWAIGCLFYEILEGRILFSETKDIELLQKVMQTFGSLTIEEIYFIEREDARKWVGKQPFSPKRKPSSYLVNYIDSKGKDLLDRCLCIDPNLRIDAFKALKHPYFAEIYDESEVHLGMIQHATKINFDFENQTNISPQELIKRILQEINGINTHF